MTPFEKQYDDIFEGLCRTAIATYERDKDHVPMIFPMREGKVMGVIPVSKFLSSAAAKELLANNLHQSFLESGVEAYAFITEAWMKSYPRDADIKNVPRPSESWDRFEILQISFDCMDFQRLRIYSIAKGKIYGIHTDMDTRKPKPDEETGELKLPPRTVGLFSNLTNPDWENIGNEFRHGPPKKADGDMGDAR